jgi:hypothetical protein
MEESFKQSRIAFIRTHFFSVVTESRKSGLSLKLKIIESYIGIAVVTPKPLIWQKRKYYNRA